MYNEEYTIKKLTLHVPLEAAHFLKNDLLLGEGGLTLFDPVTDFLTSTLLSQIPPGKSRNQNNLYRFACKEVMNTALYPRSNIGEIISILKIINRTVLQSLETKRGKSFSDHLGNGRNEMMFQNKEYS